MSVLGRSTRHNTSEGASAPGHLLSRPALRWGSTAPGWPAVIHIVIVLGVALASLELRRRVPLALDNSPYDGLLFARNAVSIESGHWLGEFTNLTLAKGPGYPIFLAGAHAAGIELKVAEQVVHLAAVGAVALALLVTTRRRWLATAAFTVLALDPSNFGEASADMLRDNLFSSLGLGAIALTFLTALGVVRRSAWVVVLLGAVTSGVAIGFFWLTREEGVTLLPPLAATVLGVVLVTWWARHGMEPKRQRGRQPKPQLARALVALVVTLVTAATPLAIVRAENSAHYGVALPNDMGDGAFLRAYADWSRVQAGDRQYRVPITEAQRRAVYAASPAAQELEPWLEANDNSWRSFDCRDGVCEYGGAWMVWALRDAAASAGHYHDGRSAQRFFARLSAEVSAACDTGVLSCARRLPASLQPIQRAPSGDLLRHFASLSTDLVTAAGLYEIPGEGDQPKIVLPPEMRAVYVAAANGIPIDDDAVAAQAATFSSRADEYRFLGDVYRSLVPLLLVGSLCGLVAACVAAARRRQETSPLLALAVALAGGVLIRLFLVALIDTAEYDAAQPRYQMPAYVLLISLGVVGVAAGLSSRRPISTPVAEHNGEDRPRADGPVFTA
jgi:hypothetical protein